MASNSSTGGVADRDGRSLTPVAAATMCPPPSEQTISKIPEILPHERVFPIQIGCDLFKLSGASLSSDAPSYFSQYFLRQMRAAEEKGEDSCAAIRTLYIDRDPVTFRDIALHLQGYHVSPRDGTHFVRLFADAQFYSLPRLISQLHEESIFTSIGHREFKIPRDLLTSPTDSPNYFSLGFAIFFSRPDDLFPGLERHNLLRPPSLLPPSVPNRSADVFAELLRLLRGYPVQIRDEAHRQALLRDARYFHFKGLEQRLIPHAISFNPLRRRYERTIRLENVQKSGLSILSDKEAAYEAGNNPLLWVNYARPYIDDAPAELVLEIGGEATVLHFPNGEPRAEFFGDTKSRVAKLLEVIATKLDLPSTTQPLGLLMASGGALAHSPTPGTTGLSEDLVRVILEADSAVVLDGKPHPCGEDLTTTMDQFEEEAVKGLSRKRRRTGVGASTTATWAVKTGQWRLCIRRSESGKAPVECVFVAVRLEAASSNLGRNSARAFIGS